MPKPIKSKQQLTVKNADAEKAPAKNGVVGRVKKNEGRRNDVNSQEISIDLLRERRYLWTARAFAIVSAVALCVNLVLLLAIVHLMPLKRVEPFLLTFQNREEQVVKIRPLSKDMAAEDIISEAMILQ